jgi:hypothetical protein
LAWLIPFSHASGFPPAGAAHTKQLSYGLVSRFRCDGVGRICGSPIQVC